MWAFDGLNSYMHFFPSAPHLYPPSNTLRVVTGTLVGISLATLVYPIFNQSMWRDWKPAPVLRDKRELLELLGLGAVLVALVLSGNPLILYPLALLSSLGVLVLLSVIYATLAATVLRLDNQANAWRDLTAPLIIGLTLGIIQIALISAGRYFFIGDIELSVLGGKILWTT
jgi:hypothetical protein